LQAWRQGGSELPPAPGVLQGQASGRKEFGKMSLTKKWQRVCAVSFFGLALTGPALSQGQPVTAPAPQTTANDSTEGKCVDTAGQALPATPPDPGADGMAPGNSGSTGWSGGTGGSQIGTNTQGALPASTTWHAPTARGLDLKGSAEATAEASEPGAANC
jgi:hypothetical protein